MNRKASKAIRVITTLLILALLLLPMAALVACRGAPPLTVEDIKDVSPDDWFYRYVVAGIRFGVIRDERGGGGDDESDEPMRFEPDSVITQGEFITMLGRLHEHGNRAIGASGDGPDYEQYMTWAIDVGIIRDNMGWDLTPCASINREQMIVLVYGYIVVFDLHDYLHHGYEMIWMRYNDHYEISRWARGQAERLRVMLIMPGRDGLYFMPHDTVSRADALQILVSVGSAVYDSVHPLMMK